ncbi:MAG: DNA repair protein RecO, partial [Hyphomicrobiales bacterium]
QALVQSAFDAIVTADGAGNIIGWNQAAAEMFGYAEAEIKGQPMARLMPERETHEGLYEAIELIADALPEVSVAAPLLVRFELEVLRLLGFGVDLSECASSGATEDLVYVSPKSGRAVSRAAGEPWKDRLLPLPAFLRGETGIGQGDVAAGFRLTGYFLARHVFEPRGVPMPDAREVFLRFVAPPV